jgi:SNF2 family DNA or RNA helicase
MRQKGNLFILWCRIAKIFNANKRSIIFSCWTRTLKLLSRYLEEANIQYFCIDGTSSLSQRQKKLKQFAKDDQTRVLIMTTGTGGFGSVNCIFDAIMIALH